MKLLEIDLCGKVYPICLNARVLVAGEREYGSMEAFAEAAFTENGKFYDTIWLLAEMLDAGYRVKKRNGEDVVKPPVKEELLDMIGLDDMGEIRRKMILAQEEDMERKVEIDTPKNAEATQQE